MKRSQIDELMEAELYPFGGVFELGSMGDPAIVDEVSQADLDKLLLGGIYHGHYRLVKRILEYEPDTFKDMQDNDAFMEALDQTMRQLLGLIEDTEDAATAAGGCGKGEKELELVRLYYATYQMVKNHFTTLWSRPICWDHCRPASAPCSPCSPCS